MVCRDIPSSLEFGLYVKIYQIYANHFKSWLKALRDLPELTPFLSLPLKDCTEEL